MVITTQDIDDALRRANNGESAYDLLLDLRLKIEEDDT